MCLGNGIPVEQLATYVWRLVDTKCRLGRKRYKGKSNLFPSKSSMSEEHLNREDSNPTIPHTRIHTNFKPWRQTLNQDISTGNQVLSVISAISMDVDSATFNIELCTSLLIYREQKFMRALEYANYRVSAKSYFHM